MNDYYAVIRRSSTLKHFGILGMRWGHRKERPIVQKTQHHEYSKHVETDKMRSLMSQMQKMESNFYKNPQLVEKYRKALASKRAKENAKYYKGGFKEAYKSYYNGYKYGDLDQGDSSTFTHYIRTDQKAKQRYNGLTTAFRNENLRVNPRISDVIKRQQGRL